MELHHLHVPTFYRFVIQLMMLVGVVIAVHDGRERDELIVANGKTILEKDNKVSEKLGSISAEISEQRTRLDHTLVRLQTLESARVVPPAQKKGSKAHGRHH